MRTPRLIALLCLASLVCAGSALAHRDDGGSRYELKMRDKVKIGHKVNVHIKAPGGDLIGLLVSANQGVTPTNWGVLDLQMPLLNLAVFRMPRNGKLKIQCHIDDDPALIGLHLYLQFIGVNPIDHANHGISNLDDFTIVDKRGGHDGDDDDDNGDD